MKKIRILLAVLLCAALLSSVIFFSEAEQAATENWQADLLKLMDPADVPSTTQIDYKNTYEDGVEVNVHDISCEITVNDITYGCEFVFEVTGEPIEDWSAVQDWLGHIVTSSASTDGSDSEKLAKAIDRAMQQERKQAQADENGELPVYASERMQIKTLRVSTPFYPELSLNKNGEATQRLQQRLIETGFLNGNADGYFGQQTQNAVEALEEYVRELEQDLIDLRAAETEAPTEAPTLEPTAVPIAMQLSDDKHELTLIPKETEQPTTEPTPQATAEPMAVAEDAVKLQPVTQVDGIADILLQAYLYSDSFVVARNPLQSGDNGIDVERLQRRLMNLGCIAADADGNYGADTSRGVRIFQHYNDLPETGVADMDTLNVLYSASAKAPEYPMLTLGSNGEAVQNLQRRLRELGFSTVGVDGDYGEGTQNAVENLQNYMRGIEEEELKAQDDALAADADMSVQLTVEVNGIADPLLQEAFYSASFRAIPETLESGATGDDVIRLQRRLSGLEYFFGSLDGQYGAATETAVRSLQKCNGITQSGIADRQTLECLFSSEAKKALKPYVVKVSTADQRVYVYGLDNNGEYTELVRTMKCSTGKDATPTPKGTYQSTTGPGARWHYFKKYNCWAQYAYYIEGDIMFHSVLYNQKNGPVTRSSVNNLGRKASHGCVRLSVEDAQWLYQNCPAKTKIIVY